MIVTGALLADRATVTDGKLVTWGAVWNDCTVAELPNRTAVPAVLVVLVADEPESREKEDLRARLLDDRGHEVAEFDLHVTLPKGTENGFALAELNLSFERAGRHIFVIEIHGGHGIVLPLHVRSA